MKKASKDEVRSVFDKTADLKCSFESQPRKVVGMTVARLKERLRGRVPQNQKEFCGFVESLGLKMDWSIPEKGYVVYDPDSPVALMDTYTAMVDFRGSCEEVDVIARSESDAKTLVALRLEREYQRGGVVRQIVKRIRGTFFL